MNTSKTIYWISTAFLAFALAGAGFANLTKAPSMVESMGHLGFPLYMLTILGTWKLLGALAVLAPGLPRVKEWAYAGIMFTFSGAVFSHLGAGDPLTTAAPPVVLAIVAATSWATRPENRRI